MSTIIMNLRGARVTPIHRGSVWQSCGKPSTKFPHGPLVECLLISLTSFLDLLKIWKAENSWKSIKFFCKF